MLKKLQAIKGCPILKGLTTDEVASFAGILEEKHLAEGTTIFVENMPGESLFMIVRGVVKISKMLAEGEEKILVVLGADEVFGEMALLDSGPRAATARIAENSILLILKRSSFDAFCLQYPALGLKILRNIINIFCLRIRENEAEYRQMLDLTFQKKS